MSPLRKEGRPRKGCCSAEAIAAEREVAGIEQKGRPVPVFVAGHYGLVAFCAGTLYRVRIDD